MTFGKPKLFLDIETRSRCDLKAAGARRYAADPSTQITTASWRWADDPCSYDACNIPGLEHLGNATMSDFQSAVARARHIVAHHINFDANVIFATLGPWGLTLDKLDCTMARAQRVSLPGGLDELCNALQVQGKSLDGHRLVMATCKPRKDGTFNEDPAIFRQLLAYNVQDVACLQSVDRMLPPLPPDELEIWRRTWRKNALGLPLDLELCERIAVKRAEVELQLSKDLRSLTNGAVAAVTQRQRIMTWLQSKKIKIPNLQKATLELWLKSEDLPFDVWQVLDHLFQSGGSAPTKAQALLDRHVNGIYQDGTRYFGARSGRGTSEGVNFFNLARPSGRNDTDDVIRRLKAIHTASFTNTELSDVLRGAVVAPPGMKLLDVDLSNIELRLSLWFAGDREKLAQLANDEDLYANTAAIGMGIPGLTKKTHPKQRQAYKKVVLSGGYAIGVMRLFNAFKTDKDLPYEFRRDLTYAQVAAIHSGYRDANWRLQACWKELDTAARAAIFNRGAIIPACGGKLLFQWRRDVDILDLTLPSGRVIPHYQPKITDEGELVFYRAKYGRMLESRAFGGSWLEIACQSSARDILTGVERQVEAELPDVQLMLDIYDSIVALAPAAVAEQRMEHIIQIMRRVPPWAEGLPLNAEGMFGDRMSK
jgi:DNA polymerase